MGDDKGAKQPGTCNKGKIRDGTNEETAAAAAAAGFVNGSGGATERTGARTKEVHENYGSPFAREASGALSLFNHIV